MSESKSLSTKMSDYYVKQRMERLLNKSYVRRVEDGREITIGFTPKGNKELLSSTYGNRRTLQRSDLPNIDKLFESSEYVESAGLSHPRKDNIVRFHYFKIPGYLHGNTAYINVAEVNEYRGRENGIPQIRKKYYVYSVTSRLIKTKKPRS